MTWYVLIGDLDIGDHQRRVGGSHKADWRAAKSPLVAERIGTAGHHREAGRAAHQISLVLRLAVDSYLAVGGARNSQEQPQRERKIAWLGALVMDLHNRVQRYSFRWLGGEKLTDLAGLVRLA